jgi:hypothetical protein
MPAEGGHAYAGCTGEDEENWPEERAGERKHDPEDGQRAQ